VQVRKKVYKEERKGEKEKGHKKEERE